MPEARDVRADVRAALEIAHLPVLNEEFEELVARYPELRAGVDRLYIDAVRYEEPALVFTPLTQKKS